MMSIIRPMSLSHCSSPPLHPSLHSSLSYYLFISLFFILYFSPFHSLFLSFSLFISLYLTLLLPITVRVLVGRRKKAIMLLGGSWCAELDGGDPMHVRIYTYHVKFFYILILYHQKYYTFFVLILVCANSILYNLSDSCFLSNINGTDIDQLLFNFCRLYSSIRSLPSSFPPFPPPSSNVLHSPSLSCYLGSELSDSHST